MNNAEPDGGAAAEPARWRNLSSDAACKWETFGRRPPKKGVSSGTNHRRQAFPSTARERDLIINAERHAEAVEPRTEIGCARRNADGDLLHDW